MECEPLSRLVGHTRPFGARVVASVVKDGRRLRVTVDDESKGRSVGVGWGGTSVLPRSFSSLPPGSLTPGTPPLSPDVSLMSRTPHRGKSGSTLSYVREGP